MLEPNVMLFMKSFSVRSVVAHLCGSALTQARVIEIANIG